MPTKKKILPPPLPPSPPSREHMAEFWAWLGYAIEQADREMAGEEVDPPEGVQRKSAEVTWEDTAIALSRLLRKNVDRENKTLAGLYFRAYAGILGPEISIEILRDSFGPAILKNCLAKKRGPTSAQHEDDRRLCAYINAIRWATGQSAREACKSLAKMRPLVRKDAASGRAWVVLDNAETIRKRYLRAGAPWFEATARMRLVYAWHCSGEPPFLNWLKSLIALDKPGPN